MSHRIGKRQNRRAQRGFVLVTMAVAAVVVFGCLGLSVDVGRMYVAKNEAQAYADAAALAAAMKLDGTAAGITAGKATALSLADKWNFMTTSFSGTTVDVATSATGPWVSANSPPSPAPNYAYVRVLATAPVAMYFIPILTGGTLSSTVNASAVAGQVLQTTSNQGLFPFSPIAFDGPTGGSHSTSPWGFVVGTQYTMRYPSNGNSECLGDDADSNHLKIGPARGFWGDSAASVAAGQITGDRQEYTLTLGQVLPGVGGAQTTIASSIENRIEQDGDGTDYVYANYLANSSHNGRRVVPMPIQSEVDGTVLGFASFLLLNDQSYGHSGNSIWCAIFVGSGVTGSTGAGANTTAGIYQVKLVQ